MIHLLWLIIVGGILAIIAIKVVKRVRREIEKD